MTLPNAEVPGNRNDRGNEALPTITKLNRGLYELIFYILGIALLVLILGWILLAATNKSVPEGVPVVIGTIVGALVGAVSSDKTR